MRHGMKVAAVISEVCNGPLPSSLAVVLAFAFAAWITHASYAASPADTFTPPETATGSQLHTTLNELVGTWAADIHSRDGHIYHEVLTLDKQPYVIVRGKRFGHANEEFSQNNGEFLAACDGYWKLISFGRLNSDRQLTLQIDGGNTTSGRRCFRELRIELLSKDKMVGRYVGSWLWPYPTETLIQYQRTQPRK
jgi:hypothetical protein